MVDTWRCLGLVFGEQEKYTVLFKAKYGEDKDPEKFSPDFALYDMIEEVMSGLKFGRRLAFGPLSQASYFEAADDLGSVENVLHGPSQTQTLLNEEIEKRKALEAEVAAMKEMANRQEALLKRLQEHIDGPSSSHGSINGSKSTPPM